MRSVRFRVVVGVWVLVALAAACGGTEAGPASSVAVSSTTAPSTTAPSTTAPSTTAPSTTTPGATDTLRTLADRRGLLIGSAVADAPLREEADYREVLAREFNLVEPEDVMKWNATQPERNRYDFAAPDRLVAFADEHDMTVRGHTLVWYQAVPPWLQDATFNRDEAIAVLRDHITTVVGRYKGRIAQWDVVNEAIAEGSAGDIGTLRDNIWLRWIGPDYIDLAFRFAHEADPAAKLYYNDYDWISPGPKTDQIIALVARLKASGVPIDGVGMQFHIVLGPLDAPAVQTKLQAMADLGLDVAITEADNGRKLPVGPAELEDQARTFAGLLGACLAVTRCRTFNMWGFTDRHSWIPDFFPGFGSATIFDERLQPKPAYAALLATLR